jgi:hypothetical protein
MMHYSGKPPHFHVEFRDLMDGNFPCKWIDRGVPINRTPRSPDLTATELFFWVKYRMQYTFQRLDGGHPIELSVFKTNN